MVLVVALAGDIVKFYDEIKVVTSVKTSFIWSVFFQNAESRVGLLEKVGIWAGTHQVNSKSFHQMQWHMTLKAFSKILIMFSTNFA